MSHTNSTTHYNLPQFLTSDKPAWLTDINNAFSDIDTAVYNAQSKANTADTNASQALLDASDAATAASTADAKGGGAVASMADTFQTTETYAVGDLVIYNNLLYICTVAVSDPGAWTGSTNWSRTTLESVINSLTASQIAYGLTTVADALDRKANNLWTYIDTITDGGSGCDVSDYKEVCLIGYANNNTKMNSFVVPIQEINGFNCSMIGSTTHKAMCSFSLSNSNILTVTDAITVVGWTSMYWRVWAR